MLLKIEGDSKRRRFPSAISPARRRFAIGVMACAPLLATCHLTGETGGLQRQIEPTVEVIKITLKPNKGTWYTDEKPKIKLQLLDSGNKERNAPEDLPIQIEAQALDGAVLQTKLVSIRQGTDSETFSLKKIGSVGGIKIKATHEKLLEGGTFISVIARPIPARRRVQNPVAGEESAQELFYVGDSFLRSTIQPAIWTLDRPLSAVPAAFEPQDAPVSELASPPRRSTLTLLYSPERRLLAGRNDPAEICVFLSRGFETETRIMLSKSAGQLEPPTAIVIPAHERRGCASLTSDQPGEVRISFQGSTPDRDFETNGDLKIHFKAPINKFDLKPAPISIPLIDKATVSITLFNGDNVAATSEERIFSVAVESGRGGGDIDPTEVTIPAGGNHTSATFIPKTRGPVIISATAEGFPTATAELVVTGIPALLLTLTFLGGFSGGLLAYWVGANQKWWRVVLGVVTGCVFYWALIFGVLPGLQHGIVLNEISAYILPTLGGWLGAEVFGLVLKRIGITGSARPQSSCGLPPL